MSKYNTEYNGWKNRATWNVAMFLGLDHYYTVRDFMKSYRGRSPYKDFLKVYGEHIGKATPDGIEWTDKSLSIRELNFAMREMKED